MVFDRASGNSRRGHRSVSRWAVVVAVALSSLALLISWDFARHVRLPGTTWSLQGWPTEELLAEKQFPAARIYLVGGLLLSGLLTLLIHWRSQVVRKEREAREAARGLIAASAQGELRELAAALENAVGGIAWLDLDGSFTAVNQAYAGVLGWTPAEMLAMPWLETVHPQDRQRLWETFRQVREASKAECEARGLRRDGSVFAMQVVMVARGGVDGQPAGHYCFMRDITARKRAEEALRESNSRLEASNQELADFAAAASHDMQEPLRKIQAFSDLLKLSYSTALDEQGRQYLDRVYSAAERMRTLVRDLLTLSRVAKTPPEPEIVDLGRVAREVVCDLELQIQAVGGRVEIGELPAVLADPTQMRQLLQNLIGNALKFRRKDVPPEVTVSGARRAGGRCQVEVRDNGIGFEEQYAEAVFAPFRRLHGRGEYDGTGLGLSVCRRIVERHGGAISARSRPGHGSTFVVALPAAPGAAVSPSPPGSAT